MEKFLAIIFIVFGVLQIILFFKVWGMTNNVSELKKMYDDSSKKLILAIYRVVDEIQKSNSNKMESKISSQEVKEEEKIVETYTEDIEKEIPEEIKKELPVIDEKGDDFKRCLNRWGILKKRGFVEQAIREYMQHTGLDRVFAEEFIKGL